jgi:mono/diheme cytochrome c family protein
MKRSLLICIAISAILPAACSLAGDVTPPPGPRPSTASTPPATLPTVAAPADSGLTYPTFKPAAAEGAAIFAQHCAACHGFTGKGDGPQSAQLQTQRPGPLPDFSAPDLARAATPAAWFQVITEGRMDKFMPPWSDTLGEAERWNLVAFLYTLSTSQTQINSGQALYAASCAECHGEGGQGDGPKASGLKVPDFTDQTFMSARTQSDFFKSVTDGAGDAAHTYQSKLTEAERWAVVDYVRAFAYAYAAPAAAPVAGQARVAGAVTNGTGGVDVPADLVVTLHGFDNFNAAQTMSTTVGVTGTYQFDNVSYTPGMQFLVSTDYQGVIYGSDIFSFTTGQPPEPVLTIYESTSDPAALRVDRMHVFFDFATGQATVGELYLISNEGDRTYAPEGGQTLQFSLPSSATDVTVQGGQEGTDFVHTTDGLALTAPVRPGPNAAQILLSFHLPYNRQLDFAQKVLYQVNALNVLLPDTGVKLSGGNLQDEGTQVIQGNAYRTYNALGVAAGDTIAFQLSGEAAGAASSANPLSASTPTTLGVGLGGLALVLVGVGYWWYQRSRASEREAAEPSSREELLQTLADLDDDFETGQIGEGEYRRERARLKAKLIQLMEE